jgi:dihydrodipicolinate reductase
MGRRLENISSALGFFNPGLTSASFQFSGKQPDCRDKFVILVRIGRRTSKHLTTRGVGIGSSEQDFLLDFAIKCMTSSSLRVMKESKRAEQVLGCCGVRVDTVAASSNLVRMRSIFCMKNFPIGY